MDTTQVAELLGTTSRILRVFLRSPFSTFVPVGSGSRYEFTDREIPTLKKRFAEWQSEGKPRPSQANKVPAAPRKPTADETRLRRIADEQVWAEEGEVELPDIRDPRIRARALADARAAEDRLMLRLLAVGLHLTQLGDN